MKKKVTVPRATRADEDAELRAEQGEPGPRKHVDPRIAVADLKPGHHLCCLYKTEEEHRALLTPFLRQGLERHEKVIYVAHAHTAESVLGYLRKDGLEVEPCVARGQLNVVAADKTYLRQGVFNPEEMIPLLRAEIERALAEGYTGLRATGEMTWALDKVLGSHRLIEYEARVNAFFPGSKCIGLCQYDLRRFSPPVLLHVLYTHPAVVVGAKMYDNFYYIPPEDFLGEDVPAALLQHCVKNLAARKGLENELHDARQQLTTVVRERVLERWKANEALPLLRSREKPSGLRFAITCPVSVSVSARGRDRAAERGKLVEIGDGGARFHLGHPLLTGAHVILDVHLPARKDQVTTMRFEGVVMRAQQKPPYEVAVRFHRKGRILRPEPPDSPADHETV